MSDEEKNKREYIQIELEKAYKTLFPWWSDFKTEYPLIVKTESTNKGYLNRFYLFPIVELTVNNAIEDISEFIGERYQAILSAAYSAGLSVATL